MEGLPLTKTNYSIQFALMYTMWPKKPTLDLFHNVVIDAPRLMAIFMIAEVLIAFT